MLLLDYGVLICKDQKVIAFVNCHTFKFFFQQKSKLVLLMMFFKN